MQNGVLGRPLCPFRFVTKTKCFREGERKRSSPGRLMLSQGIVHHNSQCFENRARIFFFLPFRRCRSGHLESLLPCSFRARDMHNFPCARQGDVIIRIRWLALCPQQLRTSLLTICQLRTVQARVCSRTGEKLVPI
jgi:hypothetical protein